MLINVNPQIAECTSPAAQQQLSAVASAWGYGMAIRGGAVALATAHVALLDGRPADVDAKPNGFRTGTPPRGSDPV